uniref:WGS project CBMI000000000 data, contig CS3069_c004525 n=1 Tax=Fusarium clavum TaxID=2594811 RepID=A0A090MIP1_9HYPO|nr:unnamed protein product [Fusarium clavum]
MGFDLFSQTLKRGHHQNPRQNITSGYMNPGDVIGYTRTDAFRYGIRHGGVISQQVGKGEM